MNNVGFFYHPEYLNHDTGAGHPERPDRLTAVVNHLLGVPEWHALTHHRPRAATAAEVQLVHPERYVSWVAQQCASGEELLDQGDTHVCRVSYEVALLAAGAVLDATDQVLSGRLNSAFCAVRPPGHHAETATAMGFCLFNNVAIGARYAQKHHGVERVAIVDWDVHHGNGTQEMFYGDSTVLYISLHQYPFYPGTGSERERGSGKGEGFTLNCPMRAGSGEKEYLDTFQARILPELDQFRPELLMISAGFDAHRDDPLANIDLTEESFGKMTEMMMNVAGRCCGGKIVSVLEGGYDLQALARSVETHVRRLLGIDKS